MGLPLMGKKLFVLIQPSILLFSHRELSKIVSFASATTVIGQQFLGPGVLNIISDCDASCTKEDKQSLLSEA